MAIERLTPTIGVAIQEAGTLDWGLINNNNFDLVDTAFSADRIRITALENISAVLPLAISKRVGHNLLRNNIFGLGTISAPEIPIFWTTQFLNGAIGNSSRTNQTTLVGTHSLRISIASVNTSPLVQLHPYPGLNILDPINDTPIANFDSRQLSNGFGYAFQTVTLSAKTSYTLSCYGKAEIPNLTLGINCHWKLGVVFKTTGGAVIHSYFTTPQINRTNNLVTGSFERTQLTFITPNLPVVIAEIWLAVEGSIPSGIGSAWFDGVQLEQATQATALDTFSMKDGSLFLDGDLVVAGNLRLQQENLFFESNEVTFTGNVQIGDNITEDTLDVYTKSSIFHGPLTVLGNVVLGDDATNDKVDIVASKTIFFDNQSPTSPQGGDVEIQGDLVVKGSTVLGDSVTQDTVIINAQLVTAGNDLSIANDLDIGGFLNVDRGVVLGSNNPALPYDTLIVKMKDGGSFFEGDVELQDDLFVKGNTILGDTATDTVTVNAGITSLYGSLYVSNALLVEGPTTFNIGTASGDNLIVVSDEIDLSAATSTSLDTPSFNVTGNMTLAGGNIASFNANNVNFAVASSPLTTFKVYSADAYFAGDGYFGGDLSLYGNITAQGDSFVFGDRFSINPSGEIALGNSSEITSNTYNNTLRVYAGDTYFGAFGSQTKGNVEIGGSLKVAGDITLGYLLDDLVTLNAANLNLNLSTNGLFKIGGGFQNNIYNPLMSDHGGITLDNKGNLSLDGKLTVKGPFDPTQIIINPLQADGYNVIDALKITSAASTPNTTFKVTSAGTIYAEQGLVLDDGYITLNNTVANLGKSDGYLVSFELYSHSTNLYTDLSIVGDLSANNLSVKDTNVDGNLTADGDLVVTGNITANGTSFAFGGAPSLDTTFDVRAHTIYLGKDGQGIGNVVIGNDLYVRNDLYVGFAGQYANDAYFNALSVNMNVASYRPDSIELAGFRVGGGFQDNPYNAFVQDHGGVTIDAYGNIYADGSIYQKGSLGFDSLVLTVPFAGDPSNTLLSIIDNSTGDGYVNFTIDGYGSMSAPYVNIDGYLCLDGTKTDNLELGTSLGAPLSTSHIVLCVDRVDTAVLYGEYKYGPPQNPTYGSVRKRALDVDTLGNLRSYSYIHTTSPGKSNLSSYSVTVGDGYYTFGDFNSSGPVQAFTNPIQEAINFLISGEVGTNGGTIFIKQGTYVLTSDLIVPDYVSLKGEGEATVLDGYGLILGGSASHVDDLKIQSATTGITISGTRSIVKNVFITDCLTGIFLTGDENIVTNNIVTDNLANGIVNTGLNNVVANNITLRNP